jgi:hypothetical protein
MLESIGRSVRQQVRIKRRHDPSFFALYITVKEANPDADLSDGRANVVRAGQAGRKRLGTSAEMEARRRARACPVSLMELGFLRWPRTI